MGFFFSSFFFPFPPFFHTPRAAVAGGRKPRLRRNSEMLQLRALAALLVSQSWGRGGGNKTGGDVFYVCMYICIYIHMYILLIKGF